MVCSFWTRGTDKAIRASARAMDIRCYSISFSRMASIKRANFAQARGFVGCEDAAKLWNATVNPAKGQLLDAPVLRGTECSTRRVMNMLDFSTGSDLGTTVNLETIKTLDGGTMVAQSDFGHSKQNLP
jgi:hypothetical protein